MHKTANVLNKLPKPLHSKAKRELQEIWMAETKADALKAFDVFEKTYVGEVRKGGHVSDEGSRRAAGVL